jgi:hypothetical protein
MSSSMASSSSSCSSTLLFVDICDHCSSYFLALSDVLPLSIELPTLLIVAPIMNEFTILAKAAV